MHYGAERLGLTVVPVSGGNTARQIMLLEDFGTEVLACTPSYALTLADAIAERQVERESLRLETLVLGAEPWTEEMRQEIESRLGVNAVDIYGLSEVMGPGVANECLVARDGLHVAEDHFIVEVIDARTTESVPEGVIGELVFTTLTKEALPLLRYRTGDLASVTRAPCPCGRTHARMSRVLGRTDDMLIIRGVNVFPSQIETALAGIAGVAPHYQIVVSRNRHLDELETQVEVTPEFFHDVGEAVFAGHDDNPCAVIRGLEKRIHQRLRETLGLQAGVKLVAPNRLPRSEGGKLCRVVDRRSPARLA
jgi:phenylacetate-CoA ligase